MKRKAILKTISILILLSILMYSIPVMAYTKEETIYSKLNSDNKIYSTIVTSKITNDNREALIDDVSNLLNIENLSGDESFSNEGNKITWQTNGNSITYQGSSEQELPIKTNIKYSLNGEDLQAHDIVGKEGKVKITLEYENLDIHTKLVNGKYVKMYTPFVVVAGTAIDNEHNKNIEISNGKIIDNGESSIAIGFAMPGLQDSLGINSSDVVIPSTIEIKMDSNDFEMNSIICYATPKILEKGDLDIFNDLDEIYSAATQLKDASNKLKDGSEALAEGASELKQGTNTALNGVKLINNSVKKSSKKLINDNSDALTSEQIYLIGQSAAKQAVAEIEKQSDTITNKMISNMKLVAEQTAISTAKEVAKQTAGATAVATAKEAALNASEETARSIISNVNKEIRNSIEKQVTNSVIEQAKAQNAELQDFSNEQVLSSIPSLNDTIKNNTNTLYAKQKQDEEAVVNSCKQSIENKFKNESYVSAIKSKAEKEASLTENDIKKLKIAADSGIDAQYEKIKEQAVNNAKLIASNTADSTAQTVAISISRKVKTGVLKEVAENMNSLSAGLDELENGLVLLDEGSNSLAEGSNTLSNGMKTFDQEGINKLYNYINGDLKDLDDRIVALEDLAEEYKTFSGLQNGNEGSVKFIIIVDSLNKKEENEVKSARVNNENSVESINEENTISNNQITTTK